MHSMKTWGSTVVVPRSLDFRSGWPPRPLYPEKRTPGIRLTGDWMGLKAGSNTEEEKSPDCPCRRLVTIPSELFQLFLTVF